MELVDFFSEMMKVNAMEDTEAKESASRELFNKLNHLDFPDHFNWVQEVFEGIHVKQRGDQTGLFWIHLETDEKRQFTYSELAENANKFLNFLRKHKVEKGDSVYMMVPSVPETWLANIATIKGGLVSVPTATTMTVRELEYRFKTYPPHAILSDETSAGIIDKALQNVSAKPKVKIVLGNVNGWSSYSVIDKESPEAEAAKTKTSDIILCFFTSGTTGLAKRVAHTAVSYPVGHLSTANIAGIRPGDIHHNLSQPGWAKWAWSSFFAPFNVGATTSGFFYPSRFDADKYLSAVDDSKVNVFCAPPTAWRAFMLQDLSKYKFEALRESISAGEPLNPEIIQTWKRHTDTEIRDFYGQTESTAMIGNPPWFKGKICAGSFGRPAFEYDIRIMDEKDEEITKPDEVGHIAVRLNPWRAIGLFDQYIGDAEKMKEVFRKGYYYTGDRAYFDDKGYWWFVGRADDVIKSSDYRVGPFEVESALVEHEAVAEAAVVGSPDPKRWQLVKGFVILKPGYDPSRQLALDLFQHCIKVLAKFKIPRIIEFVPEVPKTLSGKIRRVELREDEKEKKQKGEKAPQEYFYHEFPELKSS